MEVPVCATNDWNDFYRCDSSKGVAMSNLMMIFYVSQLFLETF